MSVNWNRIIQAQAHGVDPVTAFHREEERSRRESHERDIEAAVYRIRTNNYDPHSRAGLFPLNLPNYVMVSDMIAENPVGSKIKVFNTRSVYRAYPEIRPGEVLTLEKVDEAGIFHCKRENGHEFNLIPGTDEFRKIAGPEVDNKEL